MDYLEILPILKIELIGIHTNLYLRQSIEKDHKDTQRKLKNKPLNIEKSDIKKEIINNRVEDHEFDLDVLFDEGKIKYKEVE